MGGSGDHEDHVASYHGWNAEAEARGHDKEHHLRHDELWKHGQHKDQEKHCEDCLQGISECCAKLSAPVKKHWINILPLIWCLASASLKTLLLMMMVLLLMLVCLSMLIFIHGRSRRRILIFTTWGISICIVWWNLIHLLHRSACLLKNS